MASGNYRADHVGSLMPTLRRDGGPDPDAVIGAIELQLDAPMDVFTDGEPWRNGGVSDPGAPETITRRFADGGLGEYERLRGLAPSWARLKTTLSLPLSSGHDEVRDRTNQLLRCGVDYLQLDARHYSQLTDPGAPLPESTIPFAEQLALDQQLLAGLVVPEQATTGLYLGKAGSAFAALLREGREDLLEALFALPVDRFLVGMGPRTEDEWAFLNHVPQERLVAVGLIGADSPELEAPDDVLRRVDAAAALHGDRLAICPSSGFADAPPVDGITLRVQRQKLELVSDVARMFWGTEL